MAADPKKQGTGTNGAVAEKTAEPAQPNWKHLVSAYFERKRALEAASIELATALHKHEKTFTIPGEGVIRGVKAKGVADTFYVRCDPPEAPPESITL